MTSKPLFKFRDGDYSVIFVKKLGSTYRIVYKTTRDKKEIYVTSMVRYSSDDKRVLKYIEGLRRNKLEV